MQSLKIAQQTNAIGVIAQQSAIVEFF